MSGVAFAKDGKTGVPSTLTTPASDEACSTPYRSTIVPPRLWPISTGRSSFSVAINIPRLASTASSESSFPPATPSNPASVTA